ncbi:hypothetical protein CBOM_00517 [Ceraceosorus bombacis]|uniref:Uncharacterized protein n=1 Tax=Ceraceosorus bombacis TaxID=401625 RepID=A0A0P1B993_9BASI|nr:hypothetical protein CBOM_00517 [Ceraceosorus bombacis]
MPSRLVIDLIYDPKCVRSVVFLTFIPRKLVVSSTWKEVLPGIQGRQNPSGSVEKASHNIRTANMQSARLVIAISLALAILCAGVKGRPADWLGGRASVLDLQKGSVSPLPSRRSVRVVANDVPDRNNGKVPPKKDLPIHPPPRRSLQVIPSDLSGRTAKREEKPRDDGHDLGKRLPLQVSPISAESDGIGLEKRQEKKARFMPPIWVPPVINNPYTGLEKRLESGGECVPPACVPPVVDNSYTRLEKRNYGSICLDPEGCEEDPPELKNRANSPGTGLEKRYYGSPCLDPEGCEEDPPELKNRASGGYIGLEKRLEPICQDPDLCYPPAVKSRANKGYTALEKRLQGGFCEDPEECEGPPSHKKRANEGYVGLEKRDEGKQATPICLNPDECGPDKINDRANKDHIGLEKRLEPICEDPEKCYPPAVGTRAV